MPLVRHLYILVLFFSFKSCFVYNNNILIISLLNSAASLNYIIFRQMMINGHNGGWFDMHIMHGFCITFQLFM